jgi:hypothetical protein
MNVPAMTTRRHVALLASLLLVLALNGCQSKETPTIDTSTPKGIRPILVRAPAGLETHLRSVATRPRR